MKRLLFSFALILVFLLMIGESMAQFGPSTKISVDEIQSNAESDITVLDPLILKDTLKVEDVAEFQKEILLNPLDCEALTPEDGLFFFCDNTNVLSYFAGSPIPYRANLELLLRAKNESGSTITRGQVVGLSGSTGANPNMILVSEDDPPSVIGLARDNANNNAVGTIVTFGRLIGVDTSSYSDGQTLYLSDTPGQLGTDENNFPIAKVIRVHPSEGQLFVFAFGPGGGAGGIVEWEADTSYKEGDVVWTEIDSTKKIYVANKDTDESTFPLDDFDELSTNEDVNGDLEVSRNLNVLNSIEGGNINDRNYFKDPYFYRDTSEWTCSDDAPACELSLSTDEVLEGVNSLKFVLEEDEYIEATLTLKASHKKEQLLSVINYFRDSGDLKLEIFRDATPEQEFDLVTDDEWSLLSKSFAGNNADDIRFRVTCESANCEGYLDDVLLQRKGLEFVKTKDCAGGLDCINEFSANVDGLISPSTVSGIPKGQEGWIGDCSRPSAGLYECPASAFSARPNCQTTRNADSFTGASSPKFDEENSTATNLIFRSANLSDGAFNQTFGIHCQRTDDYKPITEQGVIIGETFSDFKFEARATSDQAVGSNTVTVVYDGFGDNNNLVTYDSGEFTMLANGRIDVSRSTIIRNSSNDANFFSWIEIDRGSGFESAELVNCSYRTTGSGRQAALACSTFLDVRKGDKIRHRVESDDSNSEIYSTGGAYSGVDIRPAPKEGQGIASIKDTVVAERPDGSTTKLCTGRNASMTSTAIFQSPEGCIDFSGVTRSAVGRWEGFKFIEGYFKDATIVTCSGIVQDTSIFGTSRNLTITAISTSSLQSDSTFSIQIQNVSGANIDFAWGLICAGTKP